MPTDALVALQASVTKVATFNGAALILPGGTPERGMVVRVLYSAATNASGANSVTFSVDVCYDGVPTLWSSDFLADPIVTLSTTAQSGEQFIPIRIVPTVVAGVITAPQIRVTATFAGAGSTPTITYSADLMLDRP
jgi:hypothetical protein